MELITEDSRVEYALKTGLVKNKSKMSYYRRVLADPRKAVSDPVLRPFVAEIMVELVRYAFKDPVIWTRLKTILTRGTQLREETETELEEAPKTLDTLRRVLRERTDV